MSLDTRISPEDRATVTADVAASTAEPTRAGVAVVVVTHQSEDVIDGCLRSVPAAMTGIDRWLVVVVDNASTDATVARAAAVGQPTTTVVALDTNAGYAAAMSFLTRSMVARSLVTWHRFG